MQEQSAKREENKVLSPDPRLGWKVIEYRRLLEKLPAGAYLCDANGLILYFNPRAVELWGREPKLNDPKDRFCGSFKLFSSTGAPLAHEQCWMALALASRREYNGCEIVIERPDGERVTVLAHANPIEDESGRLLGAVNMLIDITDRKRAEEEQQRVQAQLTHMGRLSLAGQMAAGMAHELNQPLAAIITYSEACIRRLRGGRVNSAADGELISALEGVIEQGQRAAETIRRLRDFTRKTVLQRVPVNINKLIQEGTALVASEVQQRGVKLRLELADTVSPVAADPAQVQQVLVNLVHNSLEAMSAVEATRRELIIQTAVSKNDSVVVTVSDTGPGLATEVRAQLFQPFVTTKPEGIGLGLLISHSIIKAHGGRLWATSHSGQGTTFHFTLPQKMAPSVNGA
jgi:two-component system, LuxR family, sensor kinase FixL